MTHSNDDKKKQLTWKEKLMYGLLGLGGLLLLGGLAWYGYTTYMNSSPTKIVGTPYPKRNVSFKTPDSISIPVKKVE
jgi:hypothetical protein